MSLRDESVAGLVGLVAGAFDGAVLGLVVAFSSALCFAKHLAAASALRRLQATPTVGISDLRSLLDGGGGSSSILVAVRGRVEPRDGAEALVSRSYDGHPGRSCVISRQTHTVLYDGWGGLLGWRFDFHAIFAKFWREQRKTLLSTVPFVIIENSQWLSRGYLHVNMEGSDQPLPLTIAYVKHHPIQPSLYTMLQALFGNGYPVALLEEEKVLGIGDEITAVGYCQLRDGSVELSSCKELPYFLSDQSKSELEAGLAKTSNTLLWSGIVLGAVSIGILGYAIYRNWARWKELKQRRATATQQRFEALGHNNDNEDTGIIEDGQLCVVCLMRRRRSAFIPCGHLVCCPMCAIVVEGEMSPKCPVCRQTIRTSMRIYDS